MKKKRSKKIVAGLLSAVMLCSAIPAASILIPESDISSYTVTAADDGVIYSTDFEDGSVGNFVPRMNDGDSVVLSVETGSDAYNQYGYLSGGSYLKCTGREKTWQGISYPADRLETDKEYIVSASIHTQWPGVVTLSLQYDDTSGTTHYENVTDVSSAGEKVEYSETYGEIRHLLWGDIRNAKFSFPAGSTNRSFYFECSDEKVPICLDNFELKTAPVYEIQKDIPSLKDVFANNFKFGTAATASELANVSAQALIKKHFNSLTPGNELKPESLLNQKACQEKGNNVNPQISIDSARSILDFCRDNNIPVRGHVLVWHSQTPGWFFKENFDNNGDFVSKEVMLQRMENYIKNVMEALAEEYPTVNFYAWDVVNEAWLDDGSYRQPGTYDENANKSGWVQVFGDNSFIPYAFEYARKYAPEGCKLYYNDFNEYMPQKTAAIVKMAEELKEKGLIDGIGMQSHLDVRSGNDAFPAVNVYEKAMKAFVETGLDVQVTELDATVNGNSEELFAAQAEYYKGIIDICMKYADNISAVVLWGTTDDKSWRASKYPLIFDDKFAAKLAYYSIIDGLEVPPTTEPTETEPTKAPETSEVTDTTTPDDDFISGDVTNDKKINVFDSVAIKRMLIQRSDPNIDYALALHASPEDVNGDGGLSVADLVLLNKFLTGEKVTFKKYNG